MNSKDLLTTEEMSALLPEPKENGATNEKKRRIVPYNFRRPDRLSKEQVRSLYLLHDTFAHTLSSSLPLFLRAASTIDLINIEQQSYSEYIRAISDPTVMFSIFMSPLQGTAVIEISPDIAFPLIDRMLGGAGANLAEPRAATDIELKVLEGFIAPLTDALKEAWKPIIGLEPQTVGRETRPQLLQAVAPNEIVLTLGFQVQIGESRGTMSICLPIMMLESVIEKFTQSSYSPHRPASSEQAEALLKTLSAVRFPVSAELTKTRAAANDLMSLAVGDVLRTSHRIEQPICINIGGSDKFTGNIATADGRIIVRLN